MRVVEITKHGDTSVLRQCERPDPTTPQPGFVQIAVKASGVNFADTLARMGLYPAAPKPPFVPGYEVAGIVTAVGSRKDEHLIGRRVFAGVHFGGYAESVQTWVDNIWPLPDTFSFEQGASITLNYVTAWEALYGSGSLRPGDQVLVHAAAGGVGLAAVQLAKAAGATVHGTASPSKHGRLKDHGIDRAIDYHQPDWWKALGAYDVILEALGGSSMRRSYAMLRPGGRMILYGVSSLVKGEKRSLLTAVPGILQMLRGFNVVQQVDESKSVVGLNITALWNDRGSFKSWFAQLAPELESGVISPDVHAAIPFADAAEAHRILAARENFGKVVLIP